MTGRRRHRWLLNLGAALALASCARVQKPMHPPGPEGTFYVVQFGETLASIAERERLPVEDLAEINGMKPATPLSTGQVIFVLRPQPGWASAPPPPGPPPEPDPPPPTRPDSPTLLAWPLREPRITSSFGKRWGKLHEGLDLGADPGTPVLAARDGVVLYADDTVKGYGKMVVLQHADDLLTAYAHNSALLVLPGDRVAVGQIIARVGQTGHATAPHLHFEVRKGQVPRNPLRYLPPLPAPR